MNIFHPGTFFISLALSLGFILYAPFLSRALPSSVAVPLKENHIISPFIDFKGDITLYGHGLSNLTRHTQKYPAQDAVLEERTITVRRGDRLGIIFVRENIIVPSFDSFLNILRPHINPRKIKPQQNFKITTHNSGGQTILHSFEAALPNQKKLVLIADKQAQNYQSFVLSELFYPSTVSAEGVINSTLVEAALKQELPQEIIQEMIRLFSFDLDFQRDIVKGSRFKILYETAHSQDKTITRYGKILMTAIDTGNKNYAYWYYQPEGKEGTYFDREGKSVSTTLIKTPIDASRITSYFGRRRHPVLRYTRLHQGIDFAAPSGSPVYAAGDGVIEKIGYHPKGYGRFVRIKHAGSYQTLYAHLRGYRQGLKKGKPVKQYEVIGYVGSTGLSTGPHLHYEVKLSGRAINPFNIKASHDRVLTGDELDLFYAGVQQHEARYYAHLWKKNKKPQNKLSGAFEKTRQFFSLQRTDSY